MTILRTGLQIISVLIMVAGLVWMGQGSGYFPYPASSFMINQSPWIWRGALVVAAGVACMFLSRRLKA